MTRGSRIVAIDAGADNSAPAEQLSAPVAESEISLVAEDDWDTEAPEKPRRAWFAIIAGSLSIALIIGWSALFYLANQAQMLAGAPLTQWTAWIRDWSVPVVLIALSWLIGMRNSRREAVRFAETAQLLSTESAALENRLTTVNQELSLAREFLASQSRDIDALGRIAAERLSEHSAKLASLIHDNGTRIDAIGDVSTAALENMEKLRGQLPVIASSTKDVTNNIAAAGRTAHAQIEELVSGFNRLNEFGKASETQVYSLKSTIEASLTEFTRQTEQLGTTADARFASLAERGVEFRTQLDSHEVEALAAIRTRASALSEEIEAARTLLDGHEAESLTSLRARLSSVRDESAIIARNLREAEQRALDAWKASITQLEEDLRGAIAQVGEIDEQAMESARRRLASLADEARAVDERMSERDKLFGEELARRHADFDERHGHFLTRLDQQMEALDAKLAQRRAAEEVHASQLAAHGESLAVRLGTFTEQMAAITGHGSEAERKLGASLAVLAEKLSASREALTGTEGVIATLTDNSVRLLELIQASVEHSSVRLPAAMEVSESRLGGIETRVDTLKVKISDAANDGAVLAGHADKAEASLRGSIDQVAALQTAIHTESEASQASLEAMQRALEGVRSESLALAEGAQKELRDAIEALSSSAREAVSGIEDMSATALRNLAGRLGEESAQAIDNAMRARAADVAGKLEEATTKAAAVSRDAAIQMRDQLAKVSELTGHLERRVAHARNRAEEQVDNDFSRRVALITESLNSHSIDIARAMDSEISDTAWAAYLKGDRGIFTRRAVKMLDTPQAKAIMQLYESDRSFRDHVSRYVHDFEAMLRQLLSTRDGHAMGVTVLSSDMGKLYVGLAQSIERLRK